MELFRVLKNRKFVISIIALLLINIAAFYISQQRVIEANGSSVSDYSHIFSENSSLFTDENSNKIINERNEKYQIFLEFLSFDEQSGQSLESSQNLYEEQALLINKNSLLYREYISGKYSKSEINAAAYFYSNFAYQTEYQSQYTNYINSIIDKGKELSSLKLFLKNNSFSNKLIQKSTRDFCKNKNIKLSLVNDLPITMLLNYQIGDFILIVIGIFTALVFTGNNKINLLLNTCRNGRSNLIIKQIPILFLLSVTASAIIYVSEIFIAQKIYAAPIDLSASIQSSPAFSDCIYNFNFLQFIVVYILFKAMVCILISLAFWLLISFCGNAAVISSVAGVIIALEFLLYKNISYQSNFSFLKTINVFSIFDYNNLINYNLVSLFSHPIRIDVLIFGLTIILIFIISFILLLKANHSRPIKSSKKLISLFSVLIEKLSVLQLKVQNTVYAGNFEMYKIMHIGKGMLFIIVLFIIIFNGFSTNRVVFSPVEVFLNDYYEEYGGELNDKIYNSIERMQQEIIKIDSEFEMQKELYNSGKISLDDYNMEIAKVSAYDTERQAVRILNNQIERLKQLPAGSIKAVLLNETGYNSLFDPISNQKEILISACIIIIICSSVFPIEKTSNMFVLNHCAKNGRKRLFYKKTALMFPISFIVCGVSYFSLFAKNNRIYDLNNMSADIQNLQCLQHIKFAASIKEYMILNFLFEFCFITMIALIVLSLSAFISQTATIISASFLFVLPSILCMLNIYTAKPLSIIYQFNLNALLTGEWVTVKSFIINIILFCCCVILLYMSSKRWCNTKGKAEI